MNFIIIILVVIFISILASILVIKSENKKDKILLEKRNANIYKEFIDLYKKENYKLKYQDYLNSQHWKEIRLKALDRAGYRCQLCSNRNNLNVHHNTYKNKGNEDLKDLVVLCRKCHAKFHNKPY